MRPQPMDAPARTACDPREDLDEVFRLDHLLVKDVIGQPRGLTQRRGLTMPPNRNPIRHDLWAIFSSVLTGWSFLSHVLFVPANPPQPPPLSKRPPATSPLPSRRR